MFTFINEKRHAILTKENKFVIRNEKNEEEKCYPGGEGFDLFKINNSKLLAYVEIELPPLAIKNPNGKTVLIDSDSLEEIATFEVPLTRGSLQLNNGMFVGIYGNNILLYDPPTSYQISFRVWRLNLEKCVPLTDDFFVLQTKNGGASVFSAGVNPFDYEYRFNLDSGLQFVALPGSCFLVQTKTGPHSFAMQRCQITSLNTVEIKKKQEYRADIYFKEFVLLPDNVTVVGLSEKNYLYFIHSENLQIEKLKLKLPAKIEKLILTENKNLFTILKDDRSMDMGSTFFTQKNIAERIYDDTLYPKVLTQMIGEYASPYISKKLIK